MKKKYWSIAIAIILSVGFSNASIPEAAEKVKTTPSRSNPSQYGHKADYLLVTCVDFRFQDEVTAFMQSRGLLDQYDELILPGASLGVMYEKEPSWGNAFFSQLDFIVKAHDTRNIIFMDHRDCGMYKFVFGKEHTQDHDTERALHQLKLQQVKKKILEKFPQLKVELLLMNLDGKVETIGKFDDPAV